MLGIKKMMAGEGERLVPINIPVGIQVESWTIKARAIWNIVEYRAWVISGAQLVGNMKPIGSMHKGLEGRT